jgi:predicted enzyme related to lactoylglutathione lyase
MAGLPIWYELMTPDPAAVAPFYRAVFGWDIPAKGMAMPNGSDYRMIGRADGGNAGGVLKLSEGMQQMGAKPGWLTYFHVEDVDAAAAKATELGATIHMPPTTMGGAGRMSMLSDPQGAHFYLMTPTPPPDQPDARSDVFEANTPGHCWWTELQTTDEPASTRFYIELLGWSADNAMPMGEHGNYRFVEAEGTAIGAINPWLSEWLPVSWLPYFGVDNIDVARAAAEANGATIRGEIHAVPNGDFIFTASDPAGAPIGIVGKNRGA